VAGGVAGTWGAKRTRRAGSPVREYVIRRLMKLPVVLLVVTIMVFALTRLGGSPVGIYLRHDMTQAEVAQVYARYHLDDPVVVQYLFWLGGLFRGDLGWSGVSSAPVRDLIVPKAAVTLELGIGAGLVTLIAGLALGTYGGSRRDRFGDHAARVISSVGSSLPEFWFALVALYVFYLILGLAPLGRFTPTIYAQISHPTGMYTLDALLNGNWVAFRDALYHLWLPTLVLGYVGTAEIARFMRSSLIDELGSDYVDAARARGVPERLVVRRHARRNALVPTITMAGIAFGGILQGAVVIELIFQFPGMGRWITDAVLKGDRATTMAFVLISALGYSLVNLMTDIAYAHYDPRIELGA
jgi:ABC-type dipeptide/oligopeptide/nickel transport system permease component